MDRQYPSTIVDYNSIKIVIKEDKKPEILKLDEIRLLLREAKERNHPWYPVWAVALLTGMSNAELFALRWSDVDLDKAQITVQRSYNKRTKEFKSTKAGYWRTVPISEELKLLLLQLLHHQHHGGTRDSSGSGFVLKRQESWVQGQQARIFKEFCAEISIPEIKFHTLRACFATQLLSEGPQMGLDFYRKMN